ncbi:MAG: hypothetical protein ABR509_04690 [Candidatus Limnocylindria bacterium]
MTSHPIQEPNSMRLSPLATSLALLLLTACTTASPPGDTPTDSDQPQGSASSPPSAPAADAVLRIDEGATAVGPGISIQEAVDSTSTESLLVNGALFIDPDGNVLLCDAIAESLPPQCGGLRLAVEGLDVSSIPDLQEQGAMRWAEGVQLLGTIER